MEEHLIACDKCGATEFALVQTGKHGFIYVTCRNCNTQFAIVYKRGIDQCQISLNT